MLVQLSSWKTRSTAPVGGLRRKKKKSKKTVHTDEDTESALLMEASFISSENHDRRKDKRRKMSGSSGTPLLSLTFPHQISLVGHQSDRDQSAEWKESNEMIFSSRPGPSTAFLSPSQNQVKKRSLLKTIPALFNPSTRRIYAFQKDNSVLCSWDADTASGPDDDGGETENSSSGVTKVKLPCKATQLKMLNNGGILGTLQDGTLFVGVWCSPSVNLQDADEPKKNSMCLKLTYLGQKKDEDKADSNDDAIHVHTSILEDLSFQESSLLTNTTAKKRRITNQGTAVVSQKPTPQKNQIRISVMIGTKSSNEYLLENYTVRFLGNTVQDHEQTKSSSICIPIDSDAKTLRVCNLNSQTLILSYKGKFPTSAAASSSWCQPVSMETGKATSSPFLIIDSISSMGALSSNLLVVLDTTQLVVYDINHGAIVHACDYKLLLTSGMSDTSVVKMTTDTHSGSIALLAQDDRTGKVLVMMSSLLTSEEGKESYSLADALSSSIHAKISLKAKLNLKNHSQLNGCNGDNSMLKGDKNLSKSLNGKTKHSIAAKPIFTEHFPQCLTESFDWQSKSTVGDLDQCLQQCDNLSEMHLTHILQHFICRADVEQMAKFPFLKTSSAEHSLITAQKAFLSVKKAKKRLGSKESHLFLSATSLYWTWRVLSYSKCNVALLRAAFQDSLGKAQEAQLMLFILTKFLEKVSCGSLVYPDANFDRKESTTRCVDWITALLDVERKKFMEDHECATVLDKVSDITSGLVSQSQAMIRMKGLLDSVSKRSEKSKDAAAMGSKNGQTSRYSIEMLRF